LTCTLSDPKYSVTGSDGTEIVIEEKEGKFSLTVNGTVWKRFDEEDKEIRIDQYIVSKYS